MYAWVLFLHSWLRWLVVGVALSVAARALFARSRGRPWSALDQRWRGAFLALIRVQFLLGLALYLALSPLVRAVWQDLRGAMRAAPLRFFGIEHITAMFLAVAVAEIGAARARRARDDRARHKNMLVASLGFLLLVAAGMPWPGLAHGRPLLRMTPAGFAESAPSVGVGAPALYGSRCAACHGESGDGKGVAAPVMRPLPRDFRDAAWQRSVDDSQLRAVILQGGLARQLSTNMPSHADLSEAQVRELVRFIRGVGARARP